MLSGTFESRDVIMSKQLYIPMVRPHLEYVFQVWSPSLESDISKLEKIQRRLTKIPNALKNMNLREQAKNTRTYQSRRASKKRRPHIHA